MEQDPHACRCSRAFGGRCVLARCSRGDAAARQGVGSSAPGCRRAGMVSGPGQRPFEPNERRPAVIHGTAQTVRGRWSDWSGPSFRPDRQPVSAARRLVKDRGRPPRSGVKRPWPCRVRRSDRRTRKCRLLLPAGTVSTVAPSG